MATVKEIAEKCGVSIGTVDRVLHNRGRVNPETRQRILDTAELLQYIPNRMAQSLAVRKKKLHLCFLELDATAHPFFRDINRAARMKALELEEFGVTVTFMELQIFLDESGEIAYRIDAPEGVDFSSFDGVVSPATREIILRIMNVREDLPLAFYNNILPNNHGGLITVGCDYYRAGAIAAGLCALAGEQDTKIAIVSEFDNSNIVSYTQRVAGFRARIEERYSNCQIVGTLFFKNDYEQDKKLWEEFLRKNPDISAVYLVNPGDYSICRAIHELDPEHRIRIITNDLVPIQKELLRSGIISATITQEPEKQGSIPLEALFRYLAFGEKPESPVCYTQLNICIASHIDPE